MSKLLVILIGTLLLLPGCSDPKDPKTWIKKLRDPEHASEAVKQLQKIGDPVALQPLCDLFKDFESHTILQAIISFKDKRSVPCLVKALDGLTDDKYHNVSLAAKALASLKATEAIDPLCQTLEKPLPIKSRANVGKLSVVEALGAMGDKRAVPCLMKVASKRPEEQDFHLTKQAMAALGDIGDPAAVPLLIKGLFLASTIQGPSYPKARVALVKIGKPAVQPLLDAFQGKNEELKALGKELDFGEGVIRQKTAWVLGDMMAAEAAPVMLEAFNKAKLEVEDDAINGLDGVIEAIGRIGDPKAIEPLVKGLANKKANWRLRMQILQALTVMPGAIKKAAPVMIEVMQTGYIEDDFTNLIEGAAMAFGRAIGSEAEKYEPKVVEISKNKKLSAKATQDLFKEVLERIGLAKECKDDAACYAQKVTDESISLARREKAGIMIGTVPNGRAGLAGLIKGLHNREPVLRQYMLLTAKRIGLSTDKELISTLETIAEKDSKRTIKTLGADLASEDQVALAVVRQKTGAAER